MVYGRYWLHEMSSWRTLSGSFEKKVTRSELARAAVLRGDEARHEGRHLVELAVVQLH